MISMKSDDKLFLKNVDTFIIMNCDQLQWRCPLKIKCPKLRCLKGTNNKNQVSKTLSFQTWYVNVSIFNEENEVIISWGSFRRTQCSVPISDSIQEATVTRFSSWCQVVLCGGRCSRGQGRKFLLLTYLIALLTLVTVSITSMKINLL